MISIKSYTLQITGNCAKESRILGNLQLLEFVSKIAFDQGQDIWKNQKLLNQICRDACPWLHSKLLQQFLKLYSPKGKKKLPKKPISPIMILDNQTFSIKFDNTKVYSNLWLRFQRINFPLRGKRIIEKLNLSNICEARIYSKNNKLYCKITTKNNISKPIVNVNSKSVGLDINTKHLVLSNNLFYNIKQLFHRKLEYRKNKQISRNISNFSKDFIHKLTTKIVSNMVIQGQEVLVLEDLKYLRKSSCRKLGTSKGKNLNYILNTFPFGMFRSFLEYKCIEAGIEVIVVKPHFTSKTCSSCGSLNTTRTSQPAFECLDCEKKLHADLNASRNIRDKYIYPYGPPVNPARKPPTLVVG